MIYNIQKCSIHDGNGLRTLVFLKGCPLRCPWCSNPESQSYQQEIMESPIRCISCGDCKSVCKESAISDDYRIDRNLCTNCFKCTDRCYAESKRIVGKNYSIEELYNEIKKDSPFYSIHGGGVTFSGGEPLTQVVYLKEIAKKCHDNGINVVIETCGYGEYDEFKEVLPYVDAMFIDIKHIDSEIHKDLTGMNNELILNNIKLISEFGVPITIRTPIIPGYTDSEDNIKGIAEFISTVPTVKEYELLQYHNFGEPKYSSLGRQYPLKDVVTPTNQNMNDFVRCANQILQKYKKECYWIKNNNKEVIK